MSAVTEELLLTPCRVASAMKLLSWDSLSPALYRCSSERPITFLPSVPAFASASLITASISGCGVSQARIVSASRSSAFCTVSFLVARSKLRSTLARLVPFEPAWINSGFSPEGSIAW